MCLGNICRSPTAEGTMRALVREAGMEDEVALDSAGTGAWHVGEAPDKRATATARARGIALEGRARQVRAEDFDEFDLLVAMDRSNLRALREMAPDGQAREKVRLLREFDPEGPREGEHSLDVPDPYYGAKGGFEEVLDLIEAANRGLLEHIRDGASA